MDDKLSHIIRVAKKARNDFEQGTVSRPMLRAVVRLSFPEYPPYEVIDQYLALLEGIFPDENCDLTTGYLLEQLGEGELIVGTYDGNPHVFLGIFVGLEKMIVDITADQFGGPPVYVGPMVEPWTRIPHRDLLLSSHENPSELPF